MRAVPWTGLGVVLLALGLWACPPDPTGNYSGCSTSQDCLNGYHCVQQGTGRGQCTRDDVASSSGTPASSARGAGGPSGASPAGGGSGNTTCNLEQLTATCAALGMAQDGQSCRCVVIPPAPDGSMGGCNTVLLAQVCGALGQDVDNLACRCVPVDAGVDAGPDAGVPQCRSDAECAPGAFCCGQRCLDGTPANVLAHCGCEPDRPGDQGQQCTPGTPGRACVDGRGFNLAALDGGVTGVAGALCGCITNGPSPTECGMAANGLAGICLDHRCTAQTDTACGTALLPCTALRGGDTCIAVGDGGVGDCSCDTSQLDAQAMCIPATPGMRAASRCAPHASRGNAGRCLCGDVLACAGTPNDTCCNTGSSTLACVDIGMDSANCGVCGMVCSAGSETSCRVRGSSAFAACAADYFGGSYDYMCRASGGTADNPRAGTNTMSSVRVGNVNPCVCTAFRAGGLESACPPGRYCCPTLRDGGPYGCCTLDCGAPNNSCTTTWPAPDGGVDDAG